MTTRGSSSALRMTSGPRMGLLIHLLEALDAGVRIDLRRRNRGVAEQLLDGAEIGAGVEHVGRKRVAEGVDAQAGVLVDVIEKSRHGFLYRADADALACGGDEHGAAIRPPTNGLDQLVALVLVLAQRTDCVVADRDDALLSA